MSAYDDVKAWYTVQAFQPQGKTESWPDRVLCNNGALFDGKVVLNLGCFYPEDEIELGHRAACWIAIDNVPEIIERCKKFELPATSIKFELRDMRKLPEFWDECFHVVTDFSSGDHLTEEDWIRTVRSVHRALAPAGLFLVCFAHRDGYVHCVGPEWLEKPAQGGEYGYVRTNTFEEMEHMLTSNGFEIVRRSHNNKLQMRAGLLARKV